LGWTMSQNMTDPPSGKEIRLTAYAKCAG